MNNALGKRLVVHGEALKEPLNPRRLRAPPPVVDHVLGNELPRDIAISSLPEVRLRL